MAFGCSCVPAIAKIFPGKPSVQSSNEKGEQEDGGGGDEHEAAAAASEEEEEEEEQPRAGGFDDAFPSLPLACRRPSLRTYGMLFMWRTLALPARASSSGASMVRLSPLPLAACGRMEMWKEIGAAGWSAADGDIGGHGIWGDDVGGLPGQGGDFLVPSLAKLQAGFRLDPVLADRFSQQERWRIRF
ncbi:hypothetical protein BHM03_00027072 [Ensete ventricosum]|nr:hypothetical protein BHM03_00027072 [Ensete ventricosum]